MMTRVRDVARVRFINAALTLLAVKLMLRTIGFARTLRLLERRIGTGAPVIDPAPGALDAAARSVVAAAVLIPGRVECLEQSLSLWYLLRRRGVGADLVFGMRQYPFGAHAWVSYHGEPLNEDREALRHYVAFA
jgi:Transglutaminase-like superfamily